METKIRFLEELEKDLEQIAEAEERRRSTAAAPRRRVLRRAWIGAAAAVLSIAFAIGTLAQNSGSMQPALIGIGQSSATSAAGAPLAPPAPTTNHRIQNRYHVGQPYQVPAGVDQADIAAQGNQGSSDQGATGGEGTDLSKIIRDGALAVTIPRGAFTDSAKKVLAIANANGGSILSSTTQSGESGTFTLRIPADHFDRALIRLGSLGTVDSSQVQGQDVTADYIDLQAHLKIYQSRRTVLYGLMAQANTISETLTVQNQLEQVQLNIDQITGQMRYLNNQVAESTIKLDLHEQGATSATTTSTIENPSIGHAFDRAVQGFLNIIAAIVIGLGYLIPLLVIGGAVALVVWAVRRRRYRAPSET